MTAEETLKKLAKMIGSKRTKDEIIQYMNDNKVNADILRANTGKGVLRNIGILEYAMKHAAGREVLDAILEAGKPDAFTRSQVEAALKIAQNKQSYFRPKRNVKVKDAAEKVVTAYKGNSDARIAKLEDMMTTHVVGDKESEASIKKYIKDNISTEDLGTVKGKAILQLAAQKNAGVKAIIELSTTKTFTSKQISDALKSAEDNYNKSSSRVNRRNVLAARSAVKALTTLKEEALKAKLAALDYNFKNPVGKAGEIKAQLADILDLDKDVIKKRKTLEQAVKLKLDKEIVGGILANTAYYSPGQLTRAKSQAVWNSRYNKIAFRPKISKAHHEAVGGALEEQNVAVLKNMLNNPDKYSNAKVNKFIKDNITPKNLNENKDLLALAVEKNRGVKEIAAKIDKDFPHDKILEALGESKQKREDLYKVRGSRVPGTDAHREYVAARDARKALKIMSKRVVKERIVDLKKGMKVTSVNAYFDRDKAALQLKNIVELDGEALQRDGGILKRALAGKPYPEAVSAILANPACFTLEQLDQAKDSINRKIKASTFIRISEGHYEASKSKNETLRDALNAPGVNIIVLDKMLERGDDAAAINGFIATLKEGDLANKMPDKLLINLIDKGVNVTEMLTKVNTDSFTIDQLAEAHKHASAYVDVQQEIVSQSLDKFYEVLRGKDKVEVANIFEKIAKMDPADLQDRLCHTDSAILKDNPMLLDLALANTDIGIDVILDRADANTFTPERLEDVHGKASTLGKQAIVAFAAKSFKELLDKKTPPMTPEELEQFSKLSSAMKKMDPVAYQACLKKISPQQVEANPGVLTIAANNPDIGVDVILDKKPSLKGAALLFAHGEVNQKAKEAIEKFSLNKIESLSNDAGITKVGREYVSKMFEAVNEMNPKAMDDYINEMNVSTLKAHIKEMKKDREKETPIPDQGEFEKALEAKRAKSESMSGRAGRLGSYMKNVVVGAPPSNSPVKPKQAPISFGK